MRALTENLSFLIELAGFAVMTAGAYYWFGKGPALVVVGFYLVALGYELSQS